MRAKVNFPDQIYFRLFHAVYTETCRQDHVIHKYSIKEDTNL